MVSGIVGCNIMDIPNGKTVCIQKTCNGKAGQVSLADVPLEVRRQEAKKPLFLIRYE
jgi:hypothetical protein